MGKAIFVNNRETRSVISDIPQEFRCLPKLRPPDPLDQTNPDQLWMVCDAWRSPVIDGKYVCVREPLLMPDGKLLGFFTDGISVPQLAWSIFNLMPFSMPELCAALGHDIAYSAELAPRKNCDIWLRDWSKMAGVSKGKSNTIYNVVWGFGNGVWKKHTAQSIEDARVMCQIVDAGKEPVWDAIV